MKRVVEFTLIATILHELGHCLTKYIFGPQFLTPWLPALVGLDKRGSKCLGEIGQDIEMELLGCITVLEWEDPALFSPPARLWRVDKLLGMVKLKMTQTEWYTLSTWIFLCILLAVDLIL